MNEPAKKRVGPLRTILGILFYLSGGIGGVFTIAGFLEGQAFRRRHADTGDFTGAAMLESFIVIFVLPLTVSALMAGWWLLPPRGWFGTRKQASGAADGSVARDHTFTTVFAFALAAFAVGYLAYLRYLLGPSTPGVVFWAVSSPAILMLIGLLLVAWRSLRQGR